MKTEMQAVAQAKVSGLQSAITFLAKVVTFHECYRTPTGVIDHKTCTDNFLYRPKLVNNSFCGCDFLTLD